MRDKRSDNIPTTPSVTAPAPCPSGSGPRIHGATIPTASTRRGCTVACAYVTSIRHVPPQHRQLLQGLSELRGSDRARGFIRHHHGNVTVCRFKPRTIDLSDLRISFDRTESNASWGAAAHGPRGRDPGPASTGD